MKKSAKAKKTKSDLPDFVMAMTKLVERLEVLEKKTEVILGRVSSLPHEMKQLFANAQRSALQLSPAMSSQHPGQNSQSGPKILYDAVCGDCLKNCRVPFQPKEGRAVYCPECFAIRKAGHRPKDLVSNVVVPQHMRELKIAPSETKRAAVASKRKKQTLKIPKRKKK